MPSSGPIRSQLGPALKALKDHLAAATELLRAGAERDLLQLRGEHHHLGRTLSRVDDLNEKWSNLIDRLEGEPLEFEERIYQDFPPPAAGEVVQVRQPHFMEIAEQARGVLNEIEYLLAEPDEASSQVSQGSRQTLTEAEQQEQHQSVLEHQSVRSEQGNQQFNQQPYQQVNNQFNQQQYQQVNHQQNQQQYQQVNQEFNQQQASRFQPDIRLPELRLDPFNGDPKKWPTFWQLFSANIDQRPMDNIRKMSYLLTFLQGPAKELVAGFVLSNENYTRALDLLKSRYGDSRAITEALEAELMNLHPANESTYSLRGFVDNIERICRQLEAYGHVDSSPFVSTAIKSKLPQQIVAKLVERNVVLEYGGTALSSERSCARLSRLRKKYKDALP